MFVCLFVIVALLKFSGVSCSLVESSALSGTVQQIWNFIWGREAISWKRGGIWPANLGWSGTIGHRVAEAGSGLRWLAAYQAIQALMGHCCDPGPLSCALFASGTALRPVRYLHGVIRVACVTSLFRASHSCQFSSVQCSTVTALLCLCSSFSKPRHWFLYNQRRAAWPLRKKHGGSLWFSPVSAIYLAWSASCGQPVSDQRLPETPAPAPVLTRAPTGRRSHSYPISSAPVARIQLQKAATNSTALEKWIDNWINYYYLNHAYA